VDVETTGLEVGKHEIWQICVLPLDSLYKPSRVYSPFYQELRVSRLEKFDHKAIKIPRNDFAIRQKRALDPFTAADLFEEWVAKLELPIYKKIVPLAQNWPFDREFIKEWLGYHSFHDFFHPHYRDTMVAYLYQADLADIRGERVFAKRASLSELCNRFKVKNQKPHDALQDCIATAEVYRRLLLTS